MFRTEINPEISTFKINLHNPILSLGSCFAQAMGGRMADNKFNIVNNPFGVIFNPLSLQKLLGYTINKQYPDADTYVKNLGVYYNYHFHSCFSAVDQKDLQHKVETGITDLHTYLSTCQWLILSWGTAFVYERKENNDLVANCHKVPAKEFSKRLLSRKEIIDSFEKLNNILLDLNPDIRIILTVSPVRHIRDTMAANSLSKATLRLTTDILQKDFPHVSYFPSYELMLDDLRDYRFYKEDLLHPNLQAEDYIWQKFANAYFDQESLHFLEDWKKIKEAIRHKPFHPEVEAHQKFLRATIKRIKDLPYRVDLSSEVAFLENQLI